MKKLLAIVVLGLLWSTSGNADHYLGHKPGTGLDKLSDSIKDLERSKNRNRSNSNKKRINELEEQVIYLEIKEFCRENYPNDKNKYNQCYCESLEESDAGWVCIDGWDKGKKANEIKKKSSLQEKLNYKNIEKYLTKHPCNKGIKEGIRTECFKFDEFDQSPIQEYFINVWEEGNTSRNLFLKYVNEFTQIRKKRCNSQYQEWEKKDCLYYVKKFDQSLSNIPN